MASQETGSGIDAWFIGTVFERYHQHPVSEADAAGLAGMLGPVDALADRAADGLGFDNEPADFLRVLREQRRGGGAS